MDSSSHQFIASVEINVPAHIAYALWDNCENFPEFMFGVQEVHRVTPSMLHWRAEIGGHSVEWDADITEEIPNSRISWRAITGDPVSGTIVFDAMTPERVKVTHEIVMGTPAVGDEDLHISERVAEDMRRFQAFVEKRQGAISQKRTE